MSNPTSNFGWQMPTATDLVTDLPADFEVFGQAVDTDFVDLLGGTTGQILSKTSATDLDFTWIANDQGDITGVTAGNGITVTNPTGPVPTVAINTAVTADLTTAQTLTNKTLTSPALTTPTISTLTTNGDLLYGTGSGALARTGIGSTSQVLTVSGGLPVWATPASASPLTTKGDLYTYSTTDARLAIAANYAFLTADSTASTGNAWDISAWTAFSPTITAYTGTLTTATASGNYKRVGKICVARYQWLVTVNGTGATRIVLTLPFTAKTMTGNDGQVGADREDQVTGKMCMAFQDSGSATALYVRTYDNLYPAGNLYGGQVQFIYEVA